MSHWLDFSGFNVLVTGGSNGIGLSIAQAFLDAGAAVSVTGTKHAAGDSHSDLSAFGFHQVLTEDSTSVDALFEALGDICDLFDRQECWNFIKAAGYASD